MPQPFEPAVLTTKGEELQAKVTAGQGQIEYVCMSVGSGKYSAAEKERADLKERTGLKEERNRYAFSAVYVENKTVRLIALLTNQDPLTSEGLVQEGYYINEVGIYAKERGADNSTAILYSICLTASDIGMGDYMPMYDGRNRSEITQDYILSVDDTTKVSVNMMGAVALAKDVEQYKANLEQALDGKVDKIPGKGLSANEYTDQEKAKLQGIEEGANNYTHPATHSAAMIDQDAAHQFVSALEKQEWGGAYAQATGYTDQKIADLIGGAPSTLDTLGEIAQAMQENEDVVAALHDAIGKKADAGHIHDDRYCTETEINNKLAGKANSSHTHTKSQIMDFPTSLPASDVYDWAKAPNKPGYTWGEIGGKPTSFSPVAHTHDYLPLTGGTLQGHLNINSGYLYANEGGFIPNYKALYMGNWQFYSISDQFFYFRPKEGDFGISIGVFDQRWAIHPGDGRYHLGTPNYRWAEIHCQTSVISTSDRDLKKDIIPISNEYIEFFMLLRPVSFRFKDGSSGRIHVGFISQDIETAMAQAGLSDLEFAGFCKDKKRREVRCRHLRKKLDDFGNPIEDENGEPIIEEYESIVYEDDLDSDGNPIYIYSLRYEEFIALNTAVIQRLQAKISDLEERLEDLEHLVNANK